MRRISCLFADEAQKSPEFLSVSPNGKIPAIVDPEGPGGAPIALFESGAILLYLAEKTGLLMPADPVARWEAIQWLMFQMGGVGPMVGQLGFFHVFAGKDWEDKRPRDRYAAETRRLLGVMERRLDGRTWFVGDALSIVDISLLGWIRNIVGLYRARELVDFDSYSNVARWLERGLARPAVQRPEHPSAHVTARGGEARQTALRTWLWGREERRGQTRLHVRHDRRIIPESFPVYSNVPPKEGRRCRPATSP